MPSITRANLVSRVYSRLEGNSAFYPLEEVSDAINEAIRLINLITGFLQATGTVTTVAGQSIYSVPSSVLIPTRVSLNGRYLNKTTVRRLGHAEPTWMRDTTATTHRPTQDWCPIGLKSFAIYPADANSGKILSVTGVAEPTILVNDSDAIQYPSEFADAIEEYAAHACMIKGGGTVSKAAMVSYQGFMARIQELRRYKAKISPRFRVEVEQEK